jgi:hypothetical protein
MKQRAIVALLTVLIFGAGFGAGLWSERHRPLPPPPAPLMGEFTSAQPADKNVQAAEKKAIQATAPKPYNRAQLVADIEKLRPQIDAYRAQLETLDRDFDAAFTQVLNPEQRQILDARRVRDQKRRADFESKALATPMPLTEDEILRLRQRPFEIAFWKVSITGWLEQTTKDFKLDAAQQAAVRTLLLTRRDKFLALVDSIPPPTFKLTALAASIKPLIDPAQAKPVVEPPAPAK